MVLKSVPTFRVFAYLVLASYPLASIYLARIPVIIASVAIIFMSLFVMTSCNNRFLDLLVAGKWLILYSGISFLSIQSYDLASVVGVILPVMVFLLIGMSYSCYEKMWPQQFLRMLFVACSAVIVTSFLMLLQFGALRATNAAEREVIGAFTNSVVGPASIGILFAIYCFKYTSRVRYFVFALVCIALLVLTQSRSAILMLSIALLYGFYLFSRSKGKNSYLFFLGLSLFFTLTVLGLSFVFPVAGDFVIGTLRRFSSAKDFFEAFPGALSIEALDEDVSRIVQYAAALQVIQEYPWTGIGYGSFKGLVGERFGISVTVHNMFLKGWVAIGIMGLALNILLFLAAARQINQFRKTYRREGDFFLADFFSCCLVALALLFVQAQFRGMLGDYFFLFVISSFLVFRPRFFQRDTSWQGQA